MPNFTKAIATRLNRSNSPGQTQARQLTDEVNRQSRGEGMPLVQTIGAVLTEDSSTLIASPDYETLLAIRMTTEGGLLKVQGSLAGVGAGFNRAAVYVDRQLRQGVTEQTTAGGGQLVLSTLVDVTPGNHLVELRWGLGTAASFDCNPSTSPQRDHATLIVQEVN